MNGWKTALLSAHDGDDRCGCVRRALAYVIEQWEMDERLQELGGHACPGDMANTAQVILANCWDQGHPGWGREAVGREGLEVRDV